MRWWGEKGHSSLEFALLLPFVLLLLCTALGVGGIGLRSIVAELAASRAARVARVFHGAHAGDEVLAMLPPVLFNGGAVDVGSDGRGEITIEVTSRPLIDLRALSPSAILRRSSPVVPALPDGLSDGVLRGGDTPSPYCPQNEGYSECGYPP